MYLGSLKIVILAAGKGSRLGGNDTPKPLTLLENGKSLLEMQIDSLQNYVSINQIYVVVGYHKEQIMKKFPHLFYIYNPDFSTSNTAHSLLQAVRKFDDDVLWINGDVVFHPSTLKDIIGSDRSSMLVSRSPVDDEAVKYKMNANGKIMEVSKSVKDPDGEALGMNLFVKRDLPALQKNLEACLPEDYYEKAIEVCIQHGTSIWACETEMTLCTEVDFPEDLARANRMIQDWNLIS